MIRKCINLVSLLLALMVVGCGGGTDVAGNGIGSGGTGSYTSGPVSGLGSIIVNGVRYDVESANVKDESGATLSRSELKLGMFVDVEGSPLTSGVDNDTAVATTVRVASDFVGPFTDYLPGVSFKVWGRLVRLNSKTVLAVDLASHSGAVAVYGYIGPDGYTATRVESASGTSFYKISGKVLSWNANTKKFSLGLKTYALSPSAAVPEGMGVDAWVRVRVSTVYVGLIESLLDEIPVSTLTVIAPPARDAQVARLRGVVAGALVGRRFIMNGVVVDLGSLSTSGLAANVRVMVRGRLTAGVLNATSIELEDDDTDQDREVELHGYPEGAITATQLTVRGVPIEYSLAVVDAGTPTLSNSTCIEVRGRTYNSSRRLVATRIKADNDCR